MKKYIIALISTIILLPAAAQTQKKNMPKMEFESLSHNMGTFSADTAVIVCRYKFTNTGNADLYIHQIFTSCGCTKPTYPTRAIKPGESDTITVTYDGRRNAPGNVRKRVTVHNNSDTEMIKLYLTGKMLQAKEQKNEQIEIE